MDTRRLWFPLRSNIAYFETVSPQLDLESRIKQAALLADELWFEPGMVTVEATEELVFGPIYHPASSLNEGDIRARRRASQKGKHFSLSIGVQAGPGIPAPPEAMHTFGGSGPLQTGYVAEYHLLLQDAGLGDLPWVSWGELPPEGVNAVKVRSAEQRPDETAGDAPRLSENTLLDSTLKASLNHDLAFSSVTGLPVAVDELHRPMLEWKAGREAGLTRSERAPGALALHLLAPNFTRLPWERIIELHDHDAIGAFREKLVEAEEQVAGLDESAREKALVEIGYREMLDKVRGLTKTRGGVAATLAGGVMLDVLPWGGFAYSAVTEVAALRKAETEWTAVLLALTQEQ